MKKKKIFNKKSQPKSEAEIFLDGENIPYKKERDGTIRVKFIDLSEQNLPALPDLSHVVVEEFFSCSCNKLTSLVGAPKSIGGAFFCQNNALSTLSDATQEFEFLYSDLGSYDAWEKIPDARRLPKEELERREKEEALQLERQRSPALQRDLVVRPQPLVPKK